MSQLHLEFRSQRFLLSDGKAYERPTVVNVQSNHKQNFDTSKSSNSLTAHRPFGVEHVVRVD